MALLRSGIELESLPTAASHGPRVSIANERTVSGAIRGEVIRDEVIRGEVRGEAARGEVIRGEAIRGEVIRGKISEGMRRVEDRIQIWIRLNGIDELRLG
jgi:hypothetical protein